MGPRSVNSRTDGRRSMLGGLRAVSRPIWVSLFALVLVLGLGLSAWLSPVLSVREINLLGVGQLQRQEVLGALGDVQGTPLMRVDTNAAAQRVAGIARVAQVRVKRDYPSTLTVEIVERTPWAYYEGTDGPHLIDEFGVDYAVEPPPEGLPLISTPDPLSNPELLREGLTLLDELPPPLWDQVSELAINSTDDFELTLYDGRQVRWGNAADTPLKGAVALAVLSQPGQFFDVSSPSLPTAK